MKDKELTVSELATLVYGLTAELSKAQGRIAALEDVAASYAAEIEQTEKEFFEFVNNFKDTFSDTDNKLIKEILTALDLTL